MSGNRDEDEDKFGFEQPEESDDNFEIEKGFKGFEDLEIPEESDTEEEFEDPEATQNVINSKENLHLMELDNGNEDDMNEADARKLITDCENKNKISEKESCWNQVILIYTRKLINNIIKKIQSDAELSNKFEALNEFKAFKEKFNTKDRIENIFIHIDDISTANALANINPYGTDVTTSV